MLVWLQRGCQRLPGWGGNAGAASGQDQGTLARTALPAHVLLALCVPVPALHEHLGAFPFPSPPRVSNRRERIGLREQDCPGGSPNHTEQAPPRVCYSLSFENHQKTHPTLPLAQRCFHAFNNHCIFSPPGTGVQSNSYINSKHLPCTFCVRELC